MAHVGYGVYCHGGEGGCDIGHVTGDNWRGFPFR